MPHLSRLRPYKFAQVATRQGRFPARHASTKPSPSDPKVTPTPSPDPKPLLHRLRRLWNHPDVRYTRAIFFFTSGAYFLFHVFVTHFYSLHPAEGVSMLPTLNTFGDWILVSKHYRHGRNVRIGDIVSFRHPANVNIDGCKRVIGLPGDFVVRDTPGEGEGWMYQVPEGHCVVVGDNLLFSRDSRHWGPLPMALIKGKAVAKLVPYSDDSFLGRWVPWFYPLERGLQDVEEDDVD